ncbi:MAG: Hsp20/alpha crystallin family protein [Bacteroidales bacterium]|nr:Hsp20/alpha crystallin family protein [Bacteroidales bacterium]
MRTNNIFNKEANMLQNLFNNDVIFNNDFYPNFLRKKMFCIPAVNISETDNNFVISMAAPGYEKNDFKISIIHNELTIKVEKELQNDSENKTNVYRREFSYGNFRRSFTLPQGVDANAISAEYTNGILNVNIPKAALQDLKTEIVIK